MPQGDTEVLQLCTSPQLSCFPMRLVLNCILYNKLTHISEVLPRVLQANTEPEEAWWELPPGAEVTI